MVISTEAQKLFNRSKNTFTHKNRNDKIVIVIYDKLIASIIFNHKNVSKSLETMKQYKNVIDS